MSNSPEIERNVTPPSGSSYRSRWRRFSPSMGWKAFWTEIVIVVLGVVIALAANEAVQDWTWRTRVADAETRLQGDIAWVFLWSAEKAATQPCTDAILATMSRNVLGSGETLQPVPVEIISGIGMEFVVRVPNRPYRFPVWDALVADGTASHFTPQRQALLGRMSGDMAQSRAYEAETRRLTGVLMVMRDPIALDRAVRADLLTTISQLRSLTAYERLYARQRMRMIADAGSAPSDETVERFLNVEGNHPAGSDFSGVPHYCKSHDLPVADWRDYRQVTATMGAPASGDAK